MMRCGRLLVGLLGVVALQSFAQVAGQGSWSGAPAALAGVRKDPLDLPTMERTGDPGNLPVGCNRTPEQLVHWARHNMPDVRAAIDEFARRGYQSVPAADTAISGCDRGIPFSGVTLAFLKPGAFIDSSHVVAPLILVTTRLHLVSGEPFTQVSAGLVVGDGETERIYSGDSLGMFRHSDPSFDVRLGTKGGGPKRELGREGAFDLFRDHESYFNRFVRCAGWGTIGCVIGVMRFGGAAFPAMKLAVIMTQPELGLGLLAACALVTSITCLGAQ